MTDAPSHSVMLFGTEEPPVETRILTAGPMTVELDAGNLRYIRFGGLEAIRAISYVTRDQFWGTDAADIHDLRVDEEPDRFAVTYTATSRRGAESYSYRVNIIGTPSGLRFEATGAGDTDFLTCRTGFVVLHGVEGIVGAPVLVEHVDGRETKCVFPKRIDPDCPFRDIRALTHTVSPGVQVRCEMTGDTFEMEDQRNWTDASFKTYVRPLALPQPYTIAAGETVHQAVTLRFTGTPPVTLNDDARVTVSVGDAEGSLPQIGMWVDAADLHAARSRLDTLNGLTPAFLSCYHDMTKLEVASTFPVLGEVNASVDAPLALELVVDGQDDEAALATAARASEEMDLSFRDVAVSYAEDLAFVPPGTVFDNMADAEMLYDRARQAFPKARIGGGNFVYFTELNRKPVPHASLDFIVHGTSALVHAADDRSITETIECLPYVFASMREAYGARPYHVSPAGIGSRTSPFGNDPTPNLDAVRVTMTDKDPRQRGQLGAAWHLAYIARAAEAGVDSIALGSPTGGFGLVHAPLAHAQPWFDEAGGVFPVFHVMRALYGASGSTRRATRVSSPRDIQALAFERGGATELWLANLSGEKVGIDLRGMVAKKVAYLTTDRFVEAVHDRTHLDKVEPVGSSIELMPYAVVRLLSG